MSSERVIEVASLGKGFKAYDRPSDRLVQLVFNFAARLAPGTRLKTRLRRHAEAAGRTFWALRHIDLTVNRGETVGIIGRNGSGKSTLLQIICGTLSPTEGSIQTAGRIAALLELGSGFDPEYTGRENVYMNGQLHGLSKEQIDERFAAIETFADIGEFIDQPIKTYSSGMFVRLAFAVIAHVDADILVIDEALAVGDAFFTQKCMRFLRQFMQTGTILFVSHDTSAIRSLCTRAVWIDRGVIVDEGDPKDVSNRYLQAYYESQQGKSSISAPPVAILDSNEGERLDQRTRYSSREIAATRNFTFDPSQPGTALGGSALLQSVELTREDGSRMLWMAGGELATLRIKASVAHPISEAVVGFTVKDRLGRMLFGDHTYWVCAEQPLSLAENEQIAAEFTFLMPVLAPGDYAIDVIVADAALPGEQLLLRVHDAYVFKSEAASSSTGLVGIPMRNISLSIESAVPSQD
ncbi:ABC transporter ATP-binding protein [Burkholderia sp. MSMB1078WGS]|uniref:ABC transporter ATP-binding protein n=1 Tax=Burkholderia sp. MSMB1078WGS TaxID=1637900 RepID=UPI0007578A1A|nr:ABC transporter ATP-binding protein [Burkholderia sp. MSMB1078WGS]KVT13819.1 ABC transporter ATP-binding protein [Burkholderia sp. MSMB1078WGS]